MSLRLLQNKCKRALVRSTRTITSCGEVKLQKSGRLPDGRLTDLGAMTEAERCLLCVDAPCAKACPADTKPDKFLRQLRFENVLGAAETVLDNNPLGGVCGTVCPVSRLCEGACLRKNIDGSVKIGAVQRYLHDYGVTHGLKLPPVPAGTHHRTAVLGAGPAGLAAARELARRGSQVTVFERRASAGGALRYALSPERIDHKLVEEEVKRIEDMGVKFVFNCNMKNVRDVLSKDFDAVFSSPGLQASRPVEIDNVDTYWKTQGISGALAFLESANSVEKERASFLSKDKHVVVIGGGSVAMDCAITAKSLGAKTIHIITRESLEEAPADKEEIEMALEAGAVLHTESLVTRVDGNNTVTIQSTKLFPHSVVADMKSTLQASTILIAAGQMLDEEGRVLVEGWPADGSIIVRSMASPSSITDRKEESSPKADKKASTIFVGGDAVRGGGDSVVQAVADGKKAAAEILPDRSPLPRSKISLAMDFCGVHWENPFALSSSPVTNSAEMIARAYDQGFGGSYYKTLAREDKFEIRHPSPRFSVVHARSTGGMDVGIQNMEQISDRPLADNLADIAWLRKTYPTKVTAVSIMGYCDEDWEYLARAAEGAGAHMLELNFSCPQMARTDAGHHVGQQLSLISRYTAAAKRHVNIPVVAKLTPNITDMVPAALAAQEGGADAISAINTVKSISHIDLESLRALPTIQGHSAVSGFSGKGMRPIGLRFVSELAREPKLTIPISGMGGIYTWKDCAEYISVGSTNLQATTSVMQHGYRIVEDWIDGLQHYLEGHGCHSLNDLVGRANASLTDPSHLDHATEVVSVIDPAKCIGCGACEVACSDGAAYAIKMTAPSCGSGKKAHVDRNLCVGCKLCQFVCPVNAISFEVRPRIPRPRFSK